MQPANPIQAPQARIPIAFRLLHRFERYLARHSLLGDPPVYNTTDFAWIPALEARWQEIASEYRQLLASAEPIPPFHEISPEQLPITNDALWRTFVFYAYGIEASRNCALCPGTAAAVRAIPGMQTAMFSILEPGKQLPLHRGPYKGLLRVHLALEVPSHQAMTPQHSVCAAVSNRLQIEPVEHTDSPCWIEVDGIRLHWHEGRALIFDDTYLHRAANQSRSRRCVLFIDILRPLERRADWINRTLIALIRRSPFGTRARRAFERWYQRHGIGVDA
jgi:ornithine lipid ester-linked acyl 2-hydroxylase